MQASHTHAKNALRSSYALSLLASATAIALFASACGGSLPATVAARETGQSALMGKTFAGQNKCSAKTHNRPFILEWDATDSSSLEAMAANDVVVVRYEGCELQVLESCRVSAKKGTLGNYKPTEWTAGSVEKMDIANEAELYAKLPLSIISIGSRVTAGEKFHMEYYVSGTRQAQVDEVKRADVDKISGCKGATHFVSGYNLGAFAMVSETKSSMEAKVDAKALGAGGAQKFEQLADKRGGLLSTCTGADLKDVKTCAVPIRLTLREIAE
jgi:hypothetical protein